MKSLNLSVSGQWVGAGRRRLKPLLHPSCLVGRTQVLGDGASVYLYGLARIGEEGAAGWLYHLGDALGSVRQLADGDGEVALDRSYRPYGGVLEGGGSGGSGGSAYGFAGEWTDGTGLVFLRARYMDPGVGRLLTMDPRSGIASYPRTLHRYMYGDSDPINKVDPSGLNSQPPPPWGMTPVEDIPAWVAVQMARLLYHKSGIHGLGVCTMVDPEVQLPSDTVNDIFIDYVCEFGPQHRRFNADCHLTNQLARSLTVHNLRSDFYRSGFRFSTDRANGYERYEFGTAELVYATIDSLMERDQTRFVVPVSINVTHYLGTFEYKIVHLGDRIVFEIYDQKDLASGTRIAAFDEDEPQYSVEELIEQNPGLRTAGLASIIANNNVVSILEARERDPVSQMGGGTMEMTFTWCEPLPLLGCTNWLPPWPAVVPFLQIRDCAGGGGGVGFGG
jgi:RHS repeat-associated protein